MPDRPDPDQPAAAKKMFTQPGRRAPDRKALSDGPLETR
jgi:hypothetical protein